MSTATIDPVVDERPQAQGDLTIIYWPEDVAYGRRDREADAAKPVTAPIVLIVGNNGHAHTLLPGAGVAWNSYGTGVQTLGMLVVAPGRVAVIEHDEHGRNTITSGVWVVRRAREQADIIRLVAD